MLPGMELMGCTGLAVPPAVMEHVVKVESSFNPYAIGVVGGRLARQPRSLAEALSTARMLEERGYNFSLGLAQVNRYNLARQGLDSYEKAFDTCPNLRAGSRILAECYGRSGGDWGKAVSCGELHHRLPARLRAEGLCLLAAQGGAGGSADSDHRPSYRGAIAPPGASDCPRRWKTIASGTSHRGCAGRSRHAIAHRHSRRERCRCPGADHRQPAGARRCAGAGCTGHGAAVLPEHRRGAPGAAGHADIREG